MNYDQIFKPQTLAKLNKQSQENLKKMLGDKSLMQTMIQSQQLLGEIAAAEAPYKEQLEELAKEMVEKLYPIIEEQGIVLDAKIVGMNDVNASLDEIKVNNPIKLSTRVLKKIKSIFPDAFLKKDWLDRGDDFFQIQFYKKEQSPVNMDRLDYNPQTKKFNVSLGPNDIHGRYFQNLNNAVKYLKEKQLTLQEGISPEGRRRIINSISQGAALKGAFSFYLFKDYLDAIDPTLIEKYNQIMKNSFGIYDDDNAIVMLLSALAQGAKTAGGSSKVIIDKK